MNKDYEKILIPKESCTVRRCARVTIIRNCCHHLSYRVPYKDFAESMLNLSHISSQRHHDSSLSMHKKRPIFEIGLF
jgi:hypothetical protein